MSYHPERDDVESPLGPMRVWTTSGTHIGASGTVTVNRVECRVRLDLQLRDGEWQRGYLGNDGRVNWSSVHGALMVDRVDSWRNGRYDSSVSPSARKKVEEALVSWLAEYAVGDGADLVAAGERKAADAEYEAALKAVADAGAALREAKTRLRAAVNETKGVSV